MTAIFQPAAATNAQTLTTTQVHQKLQALLQPLGAVAEVETVALPDALDRVLAADVICPVNVPPHDNSAMDGYAFAGSELKKCPVRPAPHSARRGHSPGRSALAWPSGSG